MRLNRTLIATSSPGCVGSILPLSCFPLHRARCLRLEVQQLEAEPKDSDGLRRHDLAGDVLRGYDYHSNPQHHLRSGTFLLPSLIEISTMSDGLRILCCAIGWFRSESARHRVRYHRGEVVLQRLLSEHELAYGGTGYRHRGHVRRVHHGDY